MNFWRFGKKAKPENPPNTLVIDSVKGFGLEYVEKPDGPLWRYKGQPVYWMARQNGSDAKLAAVTLPSKIENTPEELFRALNWDEVGILYTPSKGLWEKLNTWAMFGLIGLLAFMIFLIFSSIVG